MPKKLSPHAFTRFWQLHAWAGVVVSLVLYVMFLLGALSLFRAELDTWQEPLAQVPVARSYALDTAVQVALDGVEPPPRDVFLRLPVDGHGSPRVGFRRGEEFEYVWVDTRAERLVSEREPLVGFLYRLHFLDHPVTGSWLYRASGFIAMALLVVLITGVLIHLKDLARQLYQFRHHKSRRVLWSDLHKVLGVMGLPFQLMYAYTGAFIVLGGLLWGALVGPVFGGDEARARTAAFGPSSSAERQPGSAAKPLPVEALIARAQEIEPRLERPWRVRLTHYGRDNARASVEGYLSDTTPARWGFVALSALDGRVLDTQSPETDTPGERLRNWVFGLHYGLYGGVPLRALYVLLALGTCLTILSGNWVWLERRRAALAEASGAQAARSPILARLTVGVGAGAWVALAAIFLVSRCLPLDWAARGTIEELVFFGSLAACIAWALWARDTSALWWKQLGLAGLLALPVAPLAARFSTAGLFGRGPTLGVVLGVDVALVLTGALLCVTAWALWARARRSKTHAARTREPANVAPALEPLDAVRTGG